MPRHDPESPPEELRRLAAWIVRDRIGSDHLQAYMRGLLSTQLTELSSCCRSEAMLLARYHPALDPAAVAKHFRDLASDLEQKELERGAEAVEHSTATALAQSPPADGPTPTHKTAWVPEAFAAMSWTAVSIALLKPEYGDSALRLTAAGGFGLLSILYASQAVFVAWRTHHQSS